VNNADTSIDGCTLSSKIATLFREFYANIYVNSVDDECKVTEYCTTLVTIKLIYL